MGGSRIESELNTLSSAFTHLLQDQIAVFPCKPTRILKSQKHSVGVVWGHSNAQKFSDKHLLFGDTLLVVGDDALGFHEMLVKLG